MMADQGPPGRVEDGQQAAKMDDETAYRHDIKRSCAEMVSGFPLVSLVQTTQLIRHMTAPTALEPSSFASTSADMAQITARPVFDDDADFNSYAAEMTALARIKRDSTGNMSPDDARRLQSATRSFQAAVRDCGPSAQNIAWPHLPYRLTSDAHQGTSYVPLRPKKLEKRDKGLRTVAGEVLSAANFPYPSPRPSLVNGKMPIPTMLPLPPSKGNLLEETRAVMASSKQSNENAPSPDWVIRPHPKCDQDRALRDHTRQFFEDWLTSQSQDNSNSQFSAREPPRATPRSLHISSVMKRSSSPEQQLLQQQSATLTDTRSSSLHAKLEVSSTGSVTPRKVNSMAALAQSSPVSTSPDPMSLVNERYRPKSTIVVEIPAKRRMTEYGPVMTSIKRQKIGHGPTKQDRSVFSELTSDDATPYAAAPTSDDCLIVRSSPSAARILPNHAKAGRIIQPSREMTKSPAKRLHSAQETEQSLCDGLVALLEEIFDEDEIFSHLQSADIDGNERYKHFTTDGEIKGCLMLSSIKKIEKSVHDLVSSIGGRKSFEQTFGRSGSERPNQGETSGAPLERADATYLQRILKILSRSICIAERLQIFPASMTKSSLSDVPAKSPGKRKGKNAKASTRSGEKGKTEAENSQPTRRSSRSITPLMPTTKSRKNARKSNDEEGSDEEQEASEDSDSGESDDDTSRKMSKQTRKPAKRRKGNTADDNHLDDGDLEKYESGLVTLQHAMHAVKTSLTIWTGGRLAKQVYSEDLIVGCLNTIKSQLPAAVYPALSTDSEALMAPTAMSTAVGSLLYLSAGVFALLNTLLERHDLAEAVVIKAVYIAISPFFVEQGLRTNSKGAKTGVAELKIVRTEAMRLLRTIISHYPDQRHWIIEEILGYITKLPDLAKRKPEFVLDNGKSVQTLSILLIHLVQSCTSGICLRIRTELGEMQAEDAIAVDMREDDKQPIRVIAGNVEAAFTSANRCTAAIIGYLFSRSSKAPKNTTASEAEYKALLDHFVRDLIVVVDQPQWPAATLLLQAAIRSFINILEDPKISADGNSAKSAALDHLGSIGAIVYGKIAESEKMAQLNVPEGNALLPLSAILKQQDRRLLKKRHEAEERAFGALASYAPSDASYQAAADFLVTRYSFDLLQAAEILPQIVEDERSCQKFGMQVVQFQLALWETRPQAVSTLSRQDLVRDLEPLFPVHGLPLAMPSLLRAVLMSCEGAVIAFRQKALKALSSIVEQDSKMFLAPAIRQAVEARLMDSSPAVRDAALDMLGRYVTYDASLAVQYLPRILERIADAGLSVRKRVIKLLRSIYPLLQQESQVEVCTRLVGRVHDEDDGVKELAMGAVEELLFTSTQLRRSDSEEIRAASKRVDLVSHAAVLINVASASRERPSNLETAVKAIVERYHGKKAISKGKSSLAAITAYMTEVVDCLIETLIDVEVNAELDVVNCIKTIYILLSTDPSMLTVGKANHLLPYLRSAATADEQQIAEYLLKIFACVVPRMAVGHASKFAQDLQNVTRVLINKPACVGERALPDLVACYCAIVVHQTQDYGKLCSVFRACQTRLQSGIDRLHNMKNSPNAAEKEQLLRTLPILAKLVSLFCQYGDFDRLRQTSPDARLHIDAISQDSIQLQVFEQMIKVYRMTAGHPLHGTALQCLGFLYRTSPMLMLHSDSCQIMDKIFASNSSEAKVVLLRTICDFLVSQSSDDSQQEESAADVDMRQLIGNTENFADSGVGSAVIQRYLDSIIDAALISESTGALLGPALDAIAYTVKQGLAHPMQCLPALVALETSPNSAVYKKAFALHSSLHSKHSTLVNTRIAESVQAAFQYQYRNQEEANVCGCHGDPPIAKLTLWYTLMKEKRQWRLDFLKAFMRGLHIEIADKKHCEQAKVAFARFTAENLSAFEYKSQEEIFFVVKECTSLLSVAGMSLYHRLQEPDEQENDIRDLAKSSVVLSFSLCLRAHLRQLYGITDQKLAKHAPGKKSAAGDKAPIVKASARTVMDYFGLPFIDRPVTTNEDAAKQIKAYVDLIDADETIREMGDDEDERRSDN